MPSCCILTRLVAILIRQKGIKGRVYFLLESPGSTLNDLHYLQDCITTKIKSAGSNDN